MSYGYRKPGRTLLLPPTSAEFRSERQQKTNAEKPYLLKNLAGTDNLTLPRDETNFSRRTRTFLCIYFDAFHASVLPSLDARVLFFVSLSCSPALTAHDDCRSLHGSAREY